MIKRWLLTVLLLIFGGLFTSVTAWLEVKDDEIGHINQEQRRIIKELKTIQETTAWSRNIVIPYFSTMPFTKHDAELDIISFYDRYQPLYQFKVSKFIYYDNAAKMDVAFSFVPKNANDIHRFLSLRYDKGFIQIQTVNLIEGTLNGTMTIIQPMQGDNNASQH